MEAGCHEIRPQLARSMVLRVKVSKGISKGLVVLTRQQGRPVACWARWQVSPKVVKAVGHSEVSWNWGGSWWVMVKLVRT